MDHPDTERGVSEMRAASGTKIFILILGVGVFVASLLREIRRRRLGGENNSHKCFT